MFSTMPWALPLRFRDPEPYKIRDLCRAFEKTDMFEMPDEPEYVAFYIAERIKPAAPLMGDDDDLAAASILYRSASALFQVNGKPRLFGN